MNSYSKNPSWGEALAKFFGAIFLMLIAIGGFVIVVALIMMLQAYVFTQLWGWFILPLFTTAPALTYIQAIGLSLVLTFYFSGKNYANYKEKKWYGYVAGHIGSILFVWFIGWIVTLFL